jgi:hypothetical protein
MISPAQAQQGLQPSTWKGKPQGCIVRTLGRSSQSRCCRYEAAASGGAGMLDSRNSVQLHVNKLLRQHAANMQHG